MSVLHYYILHNCLLFCCLGGGRKYFIFFNSLVLQNKNNEFMKTIIMIIIGDLSKLNTLIFYLYIQLFRFTLARSMRGYTWVLPWLGSTVPQVGVSVRNEWPGWSQWKFVHLHFIKLHQLYSHISGMSALMRKDLLDKAGGFQAFGCYLAEDFFFAKYITVIVQLSYHFLVSCFFPHLLSSLYQNF